jgi:hypothetical protein
VVSFDDVKQVAAFLPGYRIVVQLVHADTKQRLDVFPFMLTASLEQAGIAYKCLKPSQLVYHWML